MVTRRPQVAVVQAWVPHYRKPFFELARHRLASHGIDLQLFHGQPYGEDAAKRGAAHVPWAVEAPNRTIRFRGRHLTWQCCFGRLRAMDLVICEQASSQLLLYALWGRHLAHRQRLALWGHGRNFQAGRASRVGEAMKRVISRRVHWWFAYNTVSADVVRSLGFPGERVTTVENAIDTTELRAAADATNEAELAQLRRTLRLRGRHVGLYVGAMYREKRIPYLIQACLELRRLVSDFEMLFVGSGPDEPLVAAAAAQHSWIHHVGARFGRARVPYFLLADVHLMPGLVGLTLLDSFSLRTPLVTVADSEHSPEVAYLRNGENGVMLPVGTTPTRYAETVAELLLDAEVRRSLIEGCLRSSRRFTVEAMTERFVHGVIAALDAPLPSRQMLASRSPRPRPPVDAPRGPRTTRRASVGTRASRRQPVG